MNVLDLILLIPFAVVGCINVFRGFCAVLEIDEEKYGKKMKKNWQVSVYFLIHIGGYLALFYVIIKYF